jgi:multicomponent K+:H+ antiporter subunit E
MNTLQRMWPRPRLSFFLWVLWLFLVNSFSPGQMLLGAILAWLIPWGTQQYWPEQARLARPWRLIPYVGMVTWDILTANLAVARLIIGPSSKLQPALVELPLDLDSPFALTILASTISLTPGTVSASLSPDRRTLLIHALHVTDEAALVQGIKARYEAPLKEIFGC